MLVFLSENAKMDIAFILDSSGSIGYRNWNSVIRFIVSYLERHYVGNSTRVMLVNYGHFMKVPIQLGQYTGIASLRDKIQGDVFFMAAYSSKTADALRDTLTALRNKGRRDAQQIAMVFTDGQTTKSWDKSGFRLVREQALQMRASGIHLISIGVGSTIDKRQLTAIASYPKLQNTFNIYQVELMKRIEESIRGLFSSKSNYIANIFSFISKLLHPKCIADIYICCFLCLAHLLY